MAHTPTLLDLAVRTAVKALDGKYRKSGCEPPYVMHAFGVMNRLVNWGVEDDITLATALHHDTDEESSASDDWLARFTDLAAQYGMRDQARQVTSHVTNELTFLPGKCQWSTKALYLQSFHDASPTALIVKMSDRICNVWDFIYDRTDYASNYFAKAHSLYAAYRSNKKALESKFSPKVFGRVQVDLDAINERFAAA